MGWGILMLGWTQEHKMTAAFFPVSFFFGRYRLLPDSLEEGGEPKFLF